jgi:Ran GTPase-activating protein (RanGAP) involved in mRNA processing and transport
VSVIIITIRSHGDIMHACAFFRIESNKIGDEGVRVLSRALKEKNSCVKYIHFRECGLTSGAAECFAEILKCNTTLKNLYFGFEKLGDRGAEFIASGLCHNTTLEELGLASIELTGAGLRFLADALKTNHTLKIIRIDRNKLGAEECRIIAEMLLTNDSLELIDLSRNPIGDDGISVILDALIKKPDALEKIGLYGCEISSREMHKFVEFFQKTTVFKRMHLGLNPIGDAGAEHIVEALKQNKSESVKEV